MNRSGFFFLTFAIIAAISITWLNSSWVTYKEFVFEQQDKQILTEQNTAIKQIQKLNIEYKYTQSTKDMIRD